MASKSDAELRNRLNREGHKIFQRTLRENWTWFSLQLDAFHTPHHKPTLELLITREVSKYNKFRQQSNAEADGIAKKARQILNAQPDWETEVVGRIRELEEGYHETVYVWVAVVNKLRHPPIQTAKEAVTALVRRTSNGAARESPALQLTEQDVIFLKVQRIAWDQPLLTE